METIIGGSAGSLGALHSIPSDIPKDCCMDSLAMAYVPMQQWRGIYEPNIALSRGTLFLELDKPFLGEEVSAK